MKGKDPNVGPDWVNFINAHQTRNSTYKELVSTGSLAIIKDIKLREMMGQLEAFTEYTYMELAYHRQFSVQDQEALHGTKKTDYLVENDNLTINSSVDSEMINQSEEVKEILRHWHEIHREFMNGLSELKKSHTL